MTGSFQYDTRQLAVGILYINLGLASPEFPSTSRSHPSYQVYVTLVPSRNLLDGSHNALFPFFVRWDVWQNVVAPIFEDGAMLVKVLESTHETLRQQINRAMLTGDLEGLIEKIEQAVLRGYQDQGYVPSEVIPTGYIVAPPTIPGAPVVPPGTNDGSPYQRFD